MSRRSFLQKSGGGFGMLALASLLGRDGLLASSDPGGNPLAPRQPHYTPKATNVIFLFMSGGPSHVDYNQLFGDTTFVIDQTLAAVGTPIAGLADGAHIAAAGHSDGEMVSFTLGFASCCREPRIRSVITMAGDLSNAGIDPMRDTGMPILHVMETNDEYDPYQHSIDWDRNNLSAPRWMLTLVNGSHVPPYTRVGT